MALAAMNTTMPPISTGLRPNRSEMGPMMNWPRPKPIMNRLIDSCAHCALEAKYSVSAGSIGTCMSVEKGPNMVKVPVKAMTAIELGRMVRPRQPDASAPGV